MGSIPEHETQEWLAALSEGGKVRVLFDGSRAPLVKLGKTCHPSIGHILPYFAFRHLRPELMPYSSYFHEVALYLVERLPESPELTMALRKLLEARDCAVRAAVDELDLS